MKIPYSNLHLYQLPNSFHLWIPLLLGLALNLLQTFNFKKSFTQGCLVLSLVDIGPVVPGKKRSMWKVYVRCISLMPKSNRHRTNFDQKNSLQSFLCTRTNGQDLGKLFLVTKWKRIKIMLGPKPVTRVTLITIQNTTLKIIIQDWSVDVKTKQDTYMYGPQANLSSVCTMS